MCFFLLKKLMMSKKNYLYFCVKARFTTKLIKIVKNPGFSRFFKDFCSKFQVFFQNFPNSRFF